MVFVASICLWLVGGGFLGAVWATALAVASETGRDAAVVFIISVSGIGIIGGVVFGVVAAVPATAAVLATARCSKSTAAVATAIANGLVVAIAAVMLGLRPSHLLDESVAAVFASGMAWVLVTGVGLALYARR